MGEEKNWLIELFCFLAVVFTTLYHYEWLYLGFVQFMNHEYIWVEFLFCFSGYFLAKSQKAHPERDPVSYVVSKIKKLYPLFLMAFVVNFVSLYWGQHPTVTEVLLHVWASKWELLCLNMSGFGTGNPVIGGCAPAYISAVLIGSPLLCWLIGRHEKVFSGVIGPLLILLFYTRIFFLTGNLGQWNWGDNFYTLGLLRGIAGMSAGALSCLLLRPVLDGAEQARRRPAKVFKGVFLVFSLIMIWGLVGFGKYIAENDLIFYVFLFAVLLAVCDTMPLKKCPVLVKKAALELGRLSYPMFLIHTFVINLFVKNLPGVNTGKTRAWILLCSMLAAKIMLLLEGYLRKCLNAQAGHKLKSWLRPLYALKGWLNQLLDTRERRDPGKPTLHGLNLLRIFFMIWILVFHGQIHYEFMTGFSHLDALIGLGAVGVTGFFMISGFVLRYTYGTQLDGGGEEGNLALAKYYKKRFSSIYPVYLFMMLAALCTGYRVPAATETLRMFLPINLGLLQSFDHYNNFYFLYNDNCWYLSTAFVLYLLFPLLNRLLNLTTASRPKSLALPLGLFLMLTVISEYFYCFNVFTLNGHFLTFYAHPVYRIPEFMAGMLISDLLQRVPDRWRSWSWAGLLTGLGVLAVGLMYLMYYTADTNYPFGMTYNLYNIVLLPAFGMMILSLCALPEKGWLCRLGKSRVVAYCSNLTFACYLAQSFALQLLDGRVLAGTLAVGRTAQCAFFGLTLICAVLLHHLVEVPGKKLWALAARGSRRERQELKG